MNIKNKNIKKALATYEEISLLGKINALLGYDTNVSLPEKGSEERAKQTAYITKLVSDKWLSKDFKSVVEKLDEADSSLSLEEKAIIRNIKHAGKFYFQVPQETIVEFSKVTSKAFMVWQKARKENYFSLFLPHLERIIELNQKIADHLGYEKNPYDALLDIYEPGLTAHKFQDIVDVLQPSLTELIEKIQKSGEKDISSQNEFSPKDQERLTHFILKKIGYDMKAGRQDISSHPFTETLGSQDIRITNRYKKDSFVESIMVAMHEGGHALYEQGVSKKYSHTPLEGGVSLGIHESQSRFWENQIGRSSEFVAFMEPVLKAYYPTQLSSFSTHDLYTLFNKVKAGLIRVEADEVTYNLHIALRFEIEKGLIDGTLMAKDLPHVWNTKMKEYVGVVPDTDTEGVLQDVHWAYGSFGYFPTYTLGNLYAAQFTKTMKKNIKIEDLVKEGNLKPILKWLQESIYVHGSLYVPEELCKRITGEDLNPQYFLEYVGEKYKNLYNL